jgi:subtilisin family serine protease
MLKRKEAYSFVMKKLGVVISSLLLSLLVIPTIQISDAPALVPVIIGFKEKQDEKLVVLHGGQLKYTYEHIPAVAASMPDNAIENLKRNPNIAYVEEDQIAQAFCHTNSFQTTPWGITKINADDVWPSYRGTSIKVAIVDTGIYLKSGDLSIDGGKNFVGTAKSNNDDNGHGTAVAGIVAALANTKGVVGVGPDVDLYAVKVLNKQGSGFYSDIIAGIDWTITNGMDVNNYSFGGPGDSQALHEIIIKASQPTLTKPHGIVQVAAAGNSGPDENTVRYPAKYPETIAVGATNSGDGIASFSSRGPELDVTAPGVQITTLAKGDKFSSFYCTTGDGTSFAAPHVTGAAALIIDKNPNLTPAEVQILLQSTAKGLGDSGFDTTFGYGRIDASAAVSATP